ncbi:MAG: MFS transporter [Oscillospiraceae bacterium]|nr:MFS transporter [Oscillospiraceae bacterium]
MKDKAAREAREIQRLEREQARPKRPGYLYYMLAIVSVVYISDEVATQIGNQMQSVVAQALFAPVFGADMAVARMSVLGTISMIGSFIALIYKPLADRYGRKRFLVMNTLGMGLGLIVISVAANIPVYLLGAFVIALFIPHDMQAVYILETTPPRHRAKLFSIIKAVATLGVMLIPLLRTLLMGDDTTKWRAVFAVPAAVAAGAALFALLMVRETDAFVVKRLEYLRMSPEQREAAQKEKTAEQAQGNVISAAKFCLRHRQLRWLLLGGAFLMWGMLITMYYETTMSYGYAGPFLAQGMALADAQAAAAPFVTQALFLFPIGSAALQLMQGFLSDHWGRKPAVIVMGVCAMAAFTLFFFGSRYNWSPPLVGLLCGAAIGSHWASTDIVGPLMCAESAPTNLRSSVLSVQPIMSGACSALAMGTGMALINKLGDASAGIVSLVIAVPGTLVGLLMIALKVRETKHVNLQAVTGREE